MCRTAIHTDPSVHVLPLPAAGPALRASRPEAAAAEAHAAGAVGGAGMCAGGSQGDGPLRGLAPVPPAVVDGAATAMQGAGGIEAGGFSSTAGVGSVVAGAGEAALAAVGQQLLLHCCLQCCGGGDDEGEEGVEGSSDGEGLAGSPGGLLELLDVQVSHITP